jgi:hypothetical protein
MRTFQFRRPNPNKPSVTQHHKGGMWWAKVITSDGQLIIKCYLTHAEAFSKALELAEMNKAAAK